MLGGEGIPDFWDFMSWPLIFVILLVCILRAYLKGPGFREPVKAKGMVAIVTGANCGIGKQIARELIYRGAKVYMLCRDKARGEEAVEILMKDGCHLDRMSLHIVDMASLKSIREFVKKFSAAETQLDILVNNAGVMLYPKFKLSHDGHEYVWQTNYLGHFFLTMLMLPFLASSKHSPRIVNMSALAHKYTDSHIDVNLVDRRENYDSRNSYAKSKLALVMFTRTLSKKLRQNGSNVTVNACHPGICFTRIMRHTPIGNNRFLSFVAAPFAWFLLKTPKDGAQTPLFLCLSKKLEGVSGKYYADLAEAEPSLYALDDPSCDNLFNTSMDWCNLAEQPDGTVIDVADKLDVSGVDSD